jgi:hypothetical protein
MRKSCLVLPILLGAVNGEAAPRPGFVLAGQTPHFSFYSRGEKVDTQRVEKRVAELEQVLGETLTHKANYYRYATAQEVEAGTGYYAAGVTFAATGDVHSTEPCHDHELVHLIAGGFGGDPGAFFQEGLAVAVGNNGEWRGQSADKLAKANAANVAAMVASFDRFEPNTAYAVAGSFVGYLVRTYGMAQVKAFFQSCGPKVDTTVAFAKAFGGSVETVAADWARSL